MSETSAVGDTSEINTRMRAVYDRIAGPYAIKNAPIYGAIIEYGTLLLAHTGPNARTLDLGCGPGRDAAWFTAQGGQVIGADLSAGMLTLAQVAIPSRAVQLDMRHLAFADSAFAGVWCMASLLHLPKAEAPNALREMYRVLAPDGALVLGVQGGVGEGWEGVAYEASAERFFARYQAEEVATLLTSTGFTVRQRGETDERGRHWLQWFAIRGA